MKNADTILEEIEMRTGEVGEDLPCEEARKTVLLLWGEDWWQAAWAVEWLS